MLTMSDACYDVIIVGGGVMGCSAAYHAVKHCKLRTLLLEQFSMPHTRGSSNGHSRIIRNFYNKERYARMMPEAYSIWREIEKQADKKLIQPTGMLQVWDGETGRRQLEESRSFMEKLGMECEMLDPKDMAQRYPMLRFSDQQWGLFDPEAGLLSPNACITALVELIKRHGGDVRDCEPVETVHPGTEVTVVTSGGRYKCRNLVLTTGPWSGGLFTDWLGLNLPLRTLVGIPCFFRTMDTDLVKPSSYSVAKGMPIMCHHFDPKEGYQFIYMIPTYEYPGLVKVATRGEPLLPQRHPDVRDTASKDEVIRQVSAYIREHLPGVDPQPAIIESCMYTVSPDGDFVIDRHPKHDNILLGTAGSGHAFKLGPVNGKLLIEMVLKKAPSYDITPFSIKRFKGTNKLSRL